MYELQAIYEHSFNKLTEKFYAKESWPEPEAISPLVNDGKEVALDRMPVCAFSLDLSLNHIPLLFALTFLRPGLLDLVPRVVLPPYLLSSHPHH